VSDDWSDHDARRRKAERIDPSVPNVARAWNHLIGGRDNFEADRRAVRELLAIAPVMGAAAPAARAFHRRVVGYLAAEAGIRQFLDVGTGMPTGGNTHEVAQDIAPQARIVYVDNDPVVIAHARALLTSMPQGRTSYLDVDARDTTHVLAGAAGCLDLSQPVAIILMGVLAFIDHADIARSVVSGLAAGVASGSYVAIHHAASDLDPSIPAAARLWNRMSPEARLVPRSRTEVISLLDDMDPVDPGLVPVDEWRPSPGYQPGAILPIYAAVGRKP
jgi:O-methyltransferase involved in polyketide biosynthesis